MMIGFGFSSFQTTDDETTYRDFHGFDALLRIDSADNLRVLVSDLIPYFSFYPCFYSSSFNILGDDNMVAIFDLCFYLEVDVVDTYHYNPSLCPFNLH